MKIRVLSAMILAFVLCACFSVTGVSAAWIYLTMPDEYAENVTSSVGMFKYGLIYITQAEVLSGVYNAANVAVQQDLQFAVDVDLPAALDAGVSVSLTIYNSTDVSYFYDKTEVVGQTNSSIGFEVVDIVQKDEILPKQKRVITLSFATLSENTAARANFELLLKFSTDKSAIGVVVGQNAAEKFDSIINTESTYTTLIDAMDARDGGWNKGSSVTYIGNVAGATSEDTAIIEGLFGENFMKMDIDGDGTAEEVTMMIKRENLDKNLDTGAEYSYTDNSGVHVVSGVEMTVYITAEELSGWAGVTVEVYAFVFTKYPGETEWTQITPLIKGTATTNNYNGYGWTANSFDTGSWRSEDGQAMKDIVQNL